MHSAHNPAPNVVLHQILMVFDSIRRKILKSTSSEYQNRIYGLTLRQSTAINQVMMLAKKEPNGISLKTLAKHMQMAVSATSLLVDHMVGKGLFERTPNPNDRRAVCIRLSEKGEEMFRTTNALLLHEMGELASILSPEELEQLQAITQKLKRKAFA